MRHAARASCAFSPVLALLLLAACGGTDATAKRATAATTPRPFAPASCPAALAAEAANAARRPGRSHLTSRVHAPTVLARPDAAGGTCEGIVDVAWFEAAPQGLRPADSVDESNGSEEGSMAALRVIRRLWRRGRVGAGGELTLMNEHEEPRSAWLVTGEVEACRTGPLKDLRLLEAADVQKGQHVVVPAERTERCFPVRSGTSVVPTGELLPIPQFTDSMTKHYAFRVLVGGEPAWIMPGVRRRGVPTNGIGPYSAIDDESPQLDCEPQQECWGSRDEAWERW